MQYESYVTVESHACQGVRFRVRRLSLSSSATARRWSDLDDPPPAPPRREAHRGVKGEGRRKGRDGVGGLLLPLLNPPRSFVLEEENVRHRHLVVIVRHHAVARQVVVGDSPGAPAYSGSPSVVANSTSPCAAADSPSCG